MASTTFIIDCPVCKAKVAATLEKSVERSGDDDNGMPWSEAVKIGKCPECETILVGRTTQIDFDGYNADWDRWSDIERVFPRPGKTFSSYRIPQVLKNSLREAERSLQAGAPTASCAMFGRALEALCRNVLCADLHPMLTDEKTLAASKKIMLSEGIKRLKEKNVIDERLYEWSQELHAFRNLAAHPDEFEISIRDAEDFQSFVYAIIEYVYDLTDRYNEFKERNKEKS